MHTYHITVTQSTGTPVCHWLTHETAYTAGDFHALVDRLAREAAAGYTGPSQGSPLGGVYLATVLPQVVDRLISEHGFRHLEAIVAYAEHARQCLRAPIAIPQSERLAKPRVLGSAGGPRLGTIRSDEDDEDEDCGGCGDCDWCEPGW